MVTIEKGDDFTFLLLDQMGIDPTGLDVGGAEAVGERATRPSSTASATCTGRARR